MAASQFWFKCCSIVVVDALKFFESTKIISTKMYHIYEQIWLMLSFGLHFAQSWSLHFDNTKIISTEID